MTGEAASGIPPNGAPPPRARVPVLATVKAALRSLYSSIGAFLLLSAPWAIVLAVLIVVVGTVGPGSPFSGTLGGAVTAFVWFVGGAVIALRWHRRVLFAEPVSAAAILRFDRRSRRFLLLAFSVGFLCMIPMLLMTLFGIALFRNIELPQAPSHWLVVLIAVPAVALSVYIGVRLALAFPLTAADTPSSPIPTAWRLSRGNVLRLFGGMALIATLFAIIERLVDSLGELVANGTSGAAALAGVLVGLFSLIWSFAQIAAQAAFLSHAYARLTGRAVPPPIRAAPAGRRPGR